MNTADILRKAKAHISDPCMWHKGGFYGGWPKREPGDFETQPTDCPACPKGAIAAVTNSPFEQEACIYLSRAVPEGWHRVVTDYNDDPDTTHADIMALFDRAIALAEADQ